METIEELKKQIEEKKLANVEAMERKKLEWELELLNNPQKAQAIAGLKKQWGWVTGMFKGIYDRLPGPERKR